MRHTLIYIASVLLFCCCVDEREQPDTPMGNFEALWTIMDEHYCFFDEKQRAFGVTWNDVYEKYRVRIDDHISNRQLFEVLGDMLAELRDGHVNMASGADMARYWTWQEAYPANVSDSLLRRYLGTDYGIASGLYYRILDDHIGYVRYASFQSAIGDGNIDDVLAALITCDGLIIDIRDNGGGSLNYAERLAAHFAHERTLVGYMQHKTGRGHNDFSSPEALYLEPSSGIRWHKPVCVLTSRGCFSAANEFASMMRQLPCVTLVGDRTGGGAGMPFSSSLPNGWMVRFSACPMYDAQGQCTEHGIDPDIHVDLMEQDAARGFDTIIETARRLIKHQRASQP
ncbi:MAG: S41 family peptidase [Prevotella sp.]|nr:S41 family peptidase [Prevotella sp.]